MQLERAQKDGILHVPYTSFLDVVKTAEEAMEVCAKRCEEDKGTDAAAVAEAATAATSGVSLAAST